MRSWTSLLFIAVAAAKGAETGKIKLSFYQEQVTLFQSGETGFVMSASFNNACNVWLQYKIQQLLEGARQRSLSSKEEN